MSALRRFWLLLTAAGLVVVSVLVTWAVVGSSAPSPTASAHTGYVSGNAASGHGAAATASDGAGTGGANPTYCCTSGNAPGLTITGQATVYGYGPAARADAIARAVADAQDQARAAASAAGFNLVGIMTIQVSAPANYPYPMSAASGGAPGTPRGAVPPTTPGASGAAAPPRSPAVPPTPAAPAAGAAGAAPKANGSSAVKSGSAIACVYGEPCPDYGYSTSASVTITWAIG